MSKNQLRLQRKALPGAILRMGAAELKAQGGRPLMSKNQLRLQRKAPTGAILRMGAAELKVQNGRG